MPTTATRYFPYGGTGPGANSGEDYWREMAKYWVVDGVISTVGTALAITATTGMVLQAGIGAAFIQGNYGAFDTTTNITVAAAHATLPRIDRIVLRNDLTNKRIEVDVVAGTPNVSPTAPALQQTTAVWEISLATVAVAAATVTLVSGNITDARTTITPQNGIPTVVNPGTRMTATGAGTIASPRVLTADQTIVSSGAGVDVSGAGTAGSPYVPVARNRRQLANPVRNASFLVWQRGTSIALISGATQYTADGWRNTSGSAASVVSQQDASDTQGSGSCFRWQRNSGQTGIGTFATGSSIRTADVKNFAGRQVTLSFRARCGANYSASGSVLSYLLYTGTAADESIHAGYTGQASPISGNATLTTSWQTFSATVTLNANVKSMATYFNFTPVGTAGANDYYEIKDVRIDEGANVLDHVPPLYDLDLEIAQRNFTRFGGASSSDLLGMGRTLSSTSAQLVLVFPVEMRAVPTPTNGTVASISVNDNGGVQACTAIASTGLTTKRQMSLDLTVAAGLTANRPCLVYTTATTGYIDVSCEF